MSTLSIFHNPRCSKSRQTLALLEEKGYQPEVVEYLKTPPNASEIERILAMLDKQPKDLMRKKETIYKDLGLADEHDPEKLVTAMVNNPKLIERPIVINGNKAAIGRPPESVLDIL
ncbi:arsenate reductase (glutaredoxin) [Idiomarina seosinensis]|uniref:Arsenate reductase n=1 Tax=Idiomarina seosinensis TaxID=281739 RepID=A0A432ZII8_9GAMM|nr:arsenate reductase (glutaredoxin) [Idiomarina seosinensis]RUO77749.1 arsenate reductase (glutaredoxin) [Idiomarina seosinensis]